MSQPVEESRNESLERGMQLIPRLSEVMPEEADPRIRYVYEDVQRTLRVPFVNFIFRVLANYPDYLATAWTGFSPYLRTMVLERAADELRTAALLEPVPDAAGVDWSTLGDLEQIRPFTDTIHYVLPKLLLVATAFDERGEEKTKGQNIDIPKAETPAGIAEGTMKIPMVSPDRAQGKVRLLYEEIKERHQHPGVASYYRSLANWPEFLEEAWRRVRLLVGSKAYEGRKEDLIELAGRAILGLPWPSKSWAAAFNSLNLPPGHVREIRAVLTVFRFRLIPDLLLDVNLIKGMLDGPAAARSSPFSVALKNDQNKKGGRL